MYNPEKQARGAGGRFGGKKVTAQAVLDDAADVGQEIAELGESIGAMALHGADQAAEAVTSSVAGAYDWAAGVAEDIDDELDEAGLNGWQKFGVGVLFLTATGGALYALIQAFGG